MILILSPIPQILFYKNESSRTKLRLLLSFFIRNMLLVRVQTKIILLCQAQFLIGE